jgi:hypothetical protein
MLLIMRYEKKYKLLARDLRLEGKTYPEIKALLKLNISKSTLSLWCSDIELTEEQKDRISDVWRTNAKKAQEQALATRAVKRKKYFQVLFDANKHLALKLQEKSVAKLVLIALYMGEGTKGLKRGSLIFANSDPEIISLFLKLLRYCYRIDERKFRCTIQGRADQDFLRLEKYWSNVTGIPLSKFYKFRIDPRSVGKVSIKKEYKGVCAINYFSAWIFHDIIQSIEVVKGR